MKKIHILESVRGFAAIYVLLHHLLDYKISTSKWIEFFFRFGQEAVMLFFLLSGFVIYYSFAKNPNQGFKEYFIRRSVRIFPIYILSLIITYAVSCLNSQYFVNIGYIMSWGNLFMLQDMGGVKPGVWFGTPGNSALWSLAYEWWFYMLFFPIMKYIRIQRRLLSVAVLSLIGFASYIIFPNQISLYLTYFIIWWTGAEVAKAYSTGEKPSIPTMKVPVAVLGLFTALELAYVLFSWKVLHEQLRLGFHPFLELRHFVSAFLVVIIALCMSRKVWQAVDKILLPFSFFAPISYAIYVFHVPLSIGAEFLSFIKYPFFELIIYMALTFGAAYVAEVQIQKWFNGVARKALQT
jgi:peptidoglycan/LPS O-acetylase OafA/YrhL